MDRSSCHRFGAASGRVPDAGPETRPVADRGSRTACHVELIEDIPTGHAVPRTLEVSTVVDPPEDPPEDPDPDHVPDRAPLAFVAPLAPAELDAAPVTWRRGQPAPRSPASVLRTADRALDELVVDRAALRALVLELARPRDPDAPVRVVIRGRRGSGRHAVIAALAAQVELRIACIDAAQLPRGPGRAVALCRALARAVIARAVPVVSGLEVRDGADPETTRSIAELLDRHRGPVVLRTAEGTVVPLAPGHVEVVLAPLTEAERRHAFAIELARHAIAGDAAQLAARHWIGPGTIARVVAAARRALVRTADPNAAVDAAVRQHAAARIAPAATQVTRPATWAQLALPADLRDRLRALISRARHGRAALDDGSDELQLATERGLSALFHGPRGTGKTLAAALVARELDLALYHVALAPLLAMHPGEAERQLDELFEAAEDGDLILLFEDADALLASPLAAAVRHRLARFEGTAIFTAQHDRAIDPAFQRQLSIRLAFARRDDDGPG